MRADSCEEYHSINIVTRSGMTTGTAKGKQHEANESVHKAVVKEIDFDLNHAKEIFKEAKKNFVEASTLGSQEKNA